MIRLIMTFICTLFNFWTGNNKQQRAQSLPLENSVPSHTHWVSVCVFLCFVCVRVHGARHLKFTSVPILVFGCDEIFHRSTSIPCSFAGSSSTSLNPVAWKCENKLRFTHTFYPKRNERGTERWERVSKEGSGGEVCSTKRRKILKHYMPLLRYV